MSNPSNPTLMTSTRLQVVQATNYLRYGADGVRRFGPGAPLGSAGMPATLRVDLILKSARDVALWSHPGLNLTRQGDTPPDFEGQVFWLGASDDLTCTWLWDFYRLTSLIQVQGAGLPWDDLSAGDKLIVMVSSAAGDILQVHTLDEAPQAEAQPD